jgi:hypothetical protein
MMIKKTAVIIISLVLIMAMLLASCGPRLEWSQSSAGTGLLPAKTTIIFSESPFLNKVVQVTAIFEMRADANTRQNVTASIIVSEGIEVVGGNTEWHGDFVSGNTYSLQASIKVMEMGKSIIGAVAMIVFQDQTDYAIGSCGLDVDVSEHEVSISYR